MTTHPYQMHGALTVETNVKTARRKRRMKLTVEPVDIEILFLVGRVLFKTFASGCSRKTIRVVASLVTMARDMTIILY